MRELVTNILITIVFLALPVGIWIVAIGVAPDSARDDVVRLTVLPWVAGAAISLVLVVGLGLRGKLRPELDRDKSARKRRSNAAWGLSAVAVVVPASLLLAALFDTDPRVVVVMFALGFLAPLLPVSAYEAYARFRSGY